MEFRILGKVCLNINGAEADLGAAKNRALLGLLLLMGTKPVLPQSLFEPLWNDEDRPPEPRETLQTYVAKLRGKLKQAGCADLLPLDLRTRTYRVAVDFDLVDYYRFKALVRRGRTALTEQDYDTAIGDLTEATRLWQGPLIAELNTDWAHQRRDTETAQTLLPAYYDLCEAHLATGNHEPVLGLLDDELAEHHLDETLARYRMRALAGAGRAHELPAYHHSFRQRHLQQRGVEPDPDLAASVEQLKHHPVSPALARSASIVDMPPSLVCALPRGIPRFTDRAEKMAELDALLLGSTENGVAPVVTLDGLPGVGKTVLAIHWSRSRSRHFPDGQLFVDLGGYRQGRPARSAELLATLLTGLGAAPAASPDVSVDLAALLHQRLVGKRILVILDNAYDSAHVRPALAALAPCPVLITSRRRLMSLARHEGVRHVSIGPLSPDDSVALIRERIASLEHSSAQDIAYLCDGLPLGLTIVTEHLASRPDVPTGELVSQLRQHKRRLLDTGSQGDDALTLGGVFSSSYAALPGDAKRLFRRLGLHPTARFSIPAAAAIAGGNVDDTEQLLEVLCGANLLRQEHADVYRLHDLLHLYAADCVEHDETAAARSDVLERMLDWYLRTAHEAYRLVAPHNPPVPELPSPTVITPLAFPDETAATQWCARERTALIAVIHTAAEHGFHHHCWRLVAEVREIFRRYGDQHESLDIHRLALTAARAVGDRTAEAGTLNNLGSVHFHLGQFDEAAGFYERALEACRETGYLPGQMALLHNLGATEVEHGNFRKGIDLYRKSLDLIEQLGSDHSRADTHYKLGEAFRRQERYGPALEHYHLALNMSQQIGDDRVHGITLGELGGLHLEAGQAERAIQYCEQALAIHRRTLDELVSAKTLATLAEARYRSREYSLALDAAVEAVAIYREAGTLSSHTRTLDLLAKAHNATGNHAAGRACWTEELKILTERDAPAADDIRAQLEALERLDLQPPIPGPGDRGGELTEQHRAAYEAALNHQGSADGASPQWEQPDDASTETSSGS